MNFKSKRKGDFSMNGIETAKSYMYNISVKKNKFLKENIEKN